MLMSVAVFLRKEKLYLIRAFIYYLQDVRYWDQYIKHYGVQVIFLLLSYSTVTIGFCTSIYDVDGIRLFDFVCDDQRCPAMILWYY